ncbi:RNA methyltransferase [Fragilaria crotonensis]|nr:RNA methyltransferase [Fragilaria crotonensis]
MRLILLTLLLSITETTLSILSLNSEVVVPRRCRYISLATSSSVNEGDVTEEKYTTLPRLYVGPPLTGSAIMQPPLTQGFRLELNSDQAHYVTKVMRIDGKKKSRLRLFDGRSGEWLGQIQVMGNRKQVDVFATCMHQLQPQSGNEEGPWVLFAPLKKPRVKLMLEKCTELGAGRFVAIQTDRTDSSSSRELLSSMDKFAMQIVEASEQCERLTLPTFSGHIDPERADSDSLLSLQELLRSWEMNAGDRQLLICRERSVIAVPVLKKLQDLSGKVAFLIGPEGGWSAEEEELFEMQRSSSMMHFVSLGSNVLRAETAAMTAVVACALTNP